MRSARFAVSYYGSVAFRAMKPSKESVYCYMIDRLCRKTDKEGHEHGDKRAATLQREHIIKLMDARAEKIPSRLQRAFTTQLDSLSNLGRGDRQKW